MSLSPVERGRELLCEFSKDPANRKAFSQLRIKCSDLSREAQNGFEGGFAYDAFNGDWFEPAIERTPSFSTMNRDKSLWLMRKAIRPFIEANFKDKDFDFQEAVAAFFRHKLKVKGDKQAASRLFKFLDKVSLKEMLTVQQKEQRKLLKQIQALEQDALKLDAQIAKLKFEGPEFCYNETAYEIVLKEIDQIHNTSDRIILLKADLKKALKHAKKGITIKDGLVNGIDLKRLTNLPNVENLPNAANFIVKLRSFDADVQKCNNEFNGLIQRRLQICDQIAILDPNHASAKKPTILPPKPYIPTEEVAAVPPVVPPTSQPVVTAPVPVVTSNVVQQPPIAQTPPQAQPILPIAITPLTRWQKCLQTLKSILKHVLAFFRSC